MTREELKKKLDEEWIPPFEYSLYGENNEGLILEQLPYGKWKTYTRDRGQVFSERQFDNETDACEYVYEKLSWLYKGLSEDKKAEVREFIKKHYPELVSANRKQEKK